MLQTSELAGTALEKWSYPFGTSDVIQNKGCIVRDCYLSGTVTHRDLKSVSGFAFWLPSFCAGFPGSNLIPMPASGKCHRVLPSAPVGTSGDCARVTGAWTCPQHHIKLWALAIVINMNLSPNLQAQSLQHSFCVQSWGKLLVKGTEAPSQPFYYCVGAKEDKGKYC